MTEQEKRLHRCCFTGHRPEKITIPESLVVQRLETAIRKTISDGHTVFISGMARGVDIWAAEIVLRLQLEGFPLRLIAASPYRGFELRWNWAWQRRYNWVLEHADLVRFICPRYSPECFQIRNEWMVDHSHRVIAVWNGQPSGTKNTIDYALQRGITVKNILNSNPN